MRRQFFVDESLNHRDWNKSALDRMESAFRTNPYAHQPYFFYRYLKARLLNSDQKFIIVGQVHYPYRLAKYLREILKNDGLIAEEDIVDETTGNKTYNVKISI